MELLVPPQSFYRSIITILLSLKTHQFSAVGVSVLDEYTHTYTHTHTHTHGTTTVTFAARMRSEG